MPLPDPTHRGHPSDALPLYDLVATADAVLDDHPGGAILRVAGDPPEVHGMCLAADHPLDVLLGFTAPPDWRGIGLHCKGRGYDLDDPRKDLPPSRCSTFASEALDAVPVTVTVIIDRYGNGDGLLRDGDVLRRLAGLPEGAVGDACRRALGLPTAPPPESSVGLWLHVWLDRVVEVVGDDPARSALTWGAVAALHPGSGGLGAAPDPQIVAESTHDLAERLPWSHLRLDPDMVDTARPPVARPVAQWMDDGMFARWMLAELVDPRVLAQTLEAVLDPAVTEQIGQSFALCGMALPMIGDDR